MYQMVTTPPLHFSEGFGDINGADTPARVGQPGGA
jgi:hypothetical protein